MRNASVSLLTAAAAIVSIAACRLGAKSNVDARLHVGDKAPALQTSRWIKGKRMAEFEAGKVYVVEFWATWCPPCRESIPHLTELAHAYKGNVTFIGVGVWERESEEVVDEFVRSMGDAMDYSVARDTSSNYMAKAWLEAAGQDGIPCAFVIGGDGNVAWIGHPMDSMGKAIDTALAKVKG